MTGYDLDLRPARPPAPSTAVRRMPVTAQLPSAVGLANEARVRLDLLAVLHACVPRVSAMVVDMTATSRIDSSGLRALLAVHGRAVELGVPFCAAAPRDDPRRMLELVDIAGRIPVFHSVAAALDAWSPPREAPAVRPHADLAGVAV